MEIKEQIHGLTDEMLTNLGRLVAIDSQLGTPAEGMPFGEGPAKHWRKDSRSQMNSDLRPSIWTITAVMQRWARARRSLVLPDIWISFR